MNSLTRCCSFYNKELTGLLTKLADDGRVLSKPRQNTRMGFFYDRLITFCKERLEVLFNSME